MCVQPVYIGNEVFDGARDQLLASLSQQEQGLFSPYATTDDLIEGLKKLDVVVKQKHRGTRFLRVVNSFSD